MFEKVLIANRGEIACRVIATCRRLGIASVAVYSDADEDALHVQLADEALRIGAAAAHDSYLNVDRIIEAARASGAPAIHPGYGFLAENPQLARSAAAAGLVFIGPPVAALEAMGSKATARELMQRAGVPVLPGYQGKEQGEAVLLAEAERIGFPVLIKPVAGGGGKGMRVVAEAASFRAALQACQREAQGAFGDTRVLLEKYLPSARHIEVQVFGDNSGTVVHLFERDCSAQRRHQKVVEEAPASGLSDAQRAELTAAARQAAAAVGYRNAGTVEFLFDDAGHFYFIEMNTRIQVEHPVTEMITGLDLVEWQLRVAAGEPLPLSQNLIPCRGHAIEARLYAENPEAGFLPSGGVLQCFVLPAATRQLRLESGVRAGDRVGIDYDPLLAKLIVCADSRELALAALQNALEQVRVSGVTTNLLFLRRFVASPAYQRGGVDTQFIERELLPLSAEPPPLVWAAATLWLMQRERPARPRAESPSPWETQEGWRLTGTAMPRTLQWERLALSDGGAAATAIELQYRHGLPWLRIGALAGEGRLQALGDENYAVRFAGRTARLQLRSVSPPGAAEILEAVLGVQAWRLRYHDPLRAESDTHVDGSGLTAPMPGRILAQLVAVGQSVLRGTPMLIMEAMKMEHTLCAPADGRVRAYLSTIGAQVPEGTVLIDFEPAV